VRERRILEVRLTDYLRKDDDRLPFHSTTICIFYSLILYYSTRSRNVNVHDCLRNGHVSWLL
jgi:hypothetical protein